MKKWIGAIFAIIILSFLGIYGLIPSTINISESVMVGSYPSVAARAFLQEENWSKWLTFQPQKEPNGSHSSVSGFGYAVTNKLNRALEIQISKENTEAMSRIYVIPEMEDSISIKWQCQLSSGKDPFSRVKSYREALSIKKDMSQILGNLKSFLEKKENIYQFPIELKTVTDTILVATRGKTKTRPTITDIYKLIDNLRQYLSAQGAFETGYPMLHSEGSDSAGFDMMVAIPVNKRLVNSGNFFLKRMVAGFILVAEVKGGQGSIDQAFLEMENFITDSQRQKIAIPFESLITDRRAEPDSSKWVTRIYFPIVK